MKKVLGVLTLKCIILLAFGQNINLYPDSLHAPFIYGVTSGEPTASSIILWTALPDDTANAQQTVTWQLAADSTFSIILQSDSVITDRSQAYTVKTMVNGLQPFTKYCYRFILNGQYSVTGFTETAPVQATDSLKFALVSCSSLFSGYFNAYRHIARDSSINAIIHVGDFIYDFIDPQEQVRLPQPPAVEPVTLEDWRNRYRLYLLDPDFREARRMHPWVQIWDNHDLKGGHYGICAEAFLNFAPVPKSATDSMQIWRKLSFGPLLDIFNVDDYQYAGRDTFPDGREKMLNDAQFTWLKSSLDSSQGVWKFLPVSKLFSPWELGPFAALAPGGGLDNSWEGYPESRDSLLGHLAQKHINNAVMLSGDLHMNIVSDLALSPYDSTTYDRETGTGGLGIEINGASISRGNADEGGIPAINAPTLDSFSFSMNPQQRYVNFFDHGYALITINSDSLIARMMLCPILQLTNLQTTDRILFCRKNDNHWLRVPVASTIEEVAKQLPFVVYPNPAGNVLNIGFRTKNNFEVEVLSTIGQTVLGAQNVHQLNISGLTSGIYFIRLSQNENYATRKFIKQ